MDGIIANVTPDKFSIHEAVNNTLQLMKHLTSSTKNISAWDLNSSLGVLEKIVTLINATGSVVEKEVTLELSILKPRLSSHIMNQYWTGKNITLHFARYLNDKNRN